EKKIITFTKIEFNGGHYILNGYISNFRGSKEPAIFAHGSRNGNIAYIEGVLNEITGLPSAPSIQREFSPLKFVEHMNSHYGVNLRNVGEGRLHIITCYSGGDNGIAQNIADILNRPTVGYGMNEGIKTELRLGIDFFMDSDPKNMIYKTVNGISTPLLARTYFPRLNL
ncbi:hypothetical protein, partial [Lelliottia amnigena]